VEDHVDGVTRTLEGIRGVSRSAIAEDAVPAARIRVRRFEGSERRRTERLVEQIQIVGVVTLWVVVRHDVSRVRADLDWVGKCHRLPATGALVREGAGSEQGAGGGP